MNKILLIDGNSILHRAQHNRKLMVGEKETTAIIGFLKTLYVQLTDRHQGCTPIVLWDSPSNWRKQQCKEYKANRGKDSKAAELKKAVNDQRLDVIKMLAVLGVRQAQARGFEADDLAGLFVEKFAPTHHVTMLTSDMDWLQLVRENTDWYCPQKDQRIQLFDFATETELDDPEKFLIAKSLQGDSSDELAGVPGIGPKAAKLIANRFGDDGPDNLIGNLRQFLIDNEGEVPKGDPLRRFNKKVRDFIPTDAGCTSEGIGLFLRNYELMDLIRVNRNLPSSVNIIRRPYDENLFRGFLEQFAFRTILRGYDDWVKPFIS